MSTNIAAVEVAIIAPKRMYIFFIRSSMTSSGSSWSSFDAASARSSIGSSEPSVVGNVVRWIRSVVTSVGAGDSGVVSSAMCALLLSVPPVQRRAPRGRTRRSLSQTGASGADDDRYPRQSRRAGARSVVDGDERVTELTLENLARRIAGKLLGHDRDPTRHLEAGETFADELLELVDGQRLAGTHHHVTRHLLAQAFVGDAVHSGFVHGGVFVDGRFDLGGVDVLAAAQHHVLRPVADVHETVVVDA